MRRGEGSRLRGGAGQRTRKPHPQNIGPLLGHQPPGFLRVLPYNHGPFPPNHRQQCGPSGPDRPPFPPAAHGLPLPPPPGLGLLGEPSPRSNFWERSHDALGRFRHRVVPNRGRGGRGNFRAPPSRYGPPDIHGSPLRKRILRCWCSVWSHIPLVCRCCEMMSTCFCSTLTACVPFK